LIDILRNNPHSLSFAEQDLPLTLPSYPTLLPYPLPHHIFNTLLQSSTSSHPFNIESNTFHHPKMKYLLKTILALSAIAGSLAAPPLDCTVVTPKKGDVWEMGKAQTVSWNCKTDGALEKQPANFLIHIELGTGKPDAFTYEDTIDAIAKAKEVKFTWVLQDKYKPGEFLVRLRSKLKGDPDPANADEANKLKWAYSDSFKIVAAGGGGGGGNGGNAGGNDNNNNNSTTPNSGYGGGGSGGSGGNGGNGGGSSGGSSGGSGNSTSGGSSNNSTGATSSGNPVAGAMSANIAMLLTTIMAVFVAGVFC
jgi:hypothetical protein